MSLGHKLIGKEFSVEFFERNQGDSGLHSRGIGVPARIDNRERREAVFTDGIFSVDGIPIGVEGRGKTSKWEGRAKIATFRHRRKVMSACKYRLFSVTYVITMLLIGGMAQLWLH